MDNLVPFVSDPLLRGCRHLRESRDLPGTSFVFPSGGKATPANDWSAEQPLSTCEGIVVMTSARLHLRPVAPADEKAILEILCDPQAAGVRGYKCLPESAAQFWEKAMRDRAAPADWEVIAYTVLE
jgi:hypothetical protein